jgi:RecA/RadA recombinase
MAAKKPAPKKTTKKKKPAAKKAPSRKKAEPAAAPPLALQEQPALATRDEAILAFVHAMNKDDRKVIVRADQAPNPYLLRRPTGIMELDIDLGGGFPAGGCSIISGPDNSGKTYLMFLAMAMQQRLYGHECRLAFAQAEGAFPFDPALNAGLKISVPDEILEQWQEVRRRRGMDLYTNEQLLFFKQETGAFYIFRGATGEELTQAMLDGVRTNAFNLIGCDSINGLAPQVDVAKGMDEHNMRASHANLVTKFFNKYVPLTTGLNGLNLTTLLFTQQVRSNQERANMASNIQKYVKPWAAGGAYAAKHFKLIDLVIWNGSTLKRGEGKARHAIGKEFKWNTEKGKAGTHDNKSGEASYYYPQFRPPGGIDLVGELMTAGIKRGVIQTRQVTKSRKEVIVARPDTGEVIEDFTAPTQKAMRAFIMEDIDYELALRREILTQAGIQCLYR